MRKLFLGLTAGLFAVGSTYSQVGIGTTSPTVELDIESSAATTNIDINNTAADGDPQINFQLSGTTTFSIGIDDTDDFFKIGTTAPATSNRLTIDNAGNVGLGTEAPDYTLDVAGNVGFNEYIYHNDDTDTYLRFQTDQFQIYVGSQYFINLVENGVSDRFVINDNGNDIDFRIEGATNGNLFATDAANDRVGVGTSSPSATFNVEGATIFNDLAADVDFRIEGISNTDLFFVDASADFVGFGTSAPDYFVDIEGDLNIGGGAANYGGTAEHIRLSAQSDTWYMGVQNEAASGDSDFYLGLAAEDGIFHIENGGNIGMGTNAPDYKLDVAGDVGFNEYIYHNDDTDTYLRFQTDQFQLYAGSKYFINIVENAVSDRLVVNDGGVDIDFRVESENNGNMLTVNAALDLVGIGMDPTTNALEVNGDASKTSAGDWSANSDRRLKTNITSLDSQEVLDKLLMMRGVSYHWNDTLTTKAAHRPTDLQYGFIAQEVQEVFPYLVKMDNEGYYQMPYGTFDPYYIEAFKAMQAQIDALKAEIEILQQENSVR